MAGHRYPSASRAKRKLYPAYNPPAAEDVENAVIASLLRGEDLEEIFLELDPDCFLESSPRPELFREAKERKVISIAEEDYRRLKLYAAEQGITITEAFSRVVDSADVLK